MSRLIPALPIPNFVLFPGCTVTLQFGFPALQEQLQLAKKESGKIVVAHSLQGSKGWIPARVACLADVRAIQSSPHGLQATLAGLARTRILGEKYVDGRLYWACDVLPRQAWKKKKYPELRAMPELVRKCRQQLPAELWLDVAAFHIPGLPLEQKLNLLAEPDPNLRYHQLLESTRSKKTSPKNSLN